MSLQHEKTWPPTPAEFGYQRCPVCGTWRAPGNLAPYRTPGSDEGLPAVTRCKQLDFCEASRPKVDP